MQQLEEVRQELEENLEDLIGEIGALECVLHGRQNSTVFSRQSPTILEAYLLRSLHYIEQFTREIRFLSERLVERAGLYTKE